VNCAADQTVSLNNDCEAALQDYTGNVNVTDNCTNSTMLNTVQSPLPGTIVSGHNTTVPVTITVTDAEGNSTDCTFNVTLLDDELPSIVCPSDQVLSSDLNCEAILPDYTSLANVSDNCSPAGSLVISQSPVAGTTVSGTTLVTLEVTDVLLSIVTQYCLILQDW